MVVQPRPTPHVHKGLTPRYRQQRRHARKTASTQESEHQTRARTCTWTSPPRGAPFESFSCMPEGRGGEGGKGGREGGGGRNRLKGVGGVLVWYKRAGQGRVQDGRVSLTYRHPAIEHGTVAVQFKPTQEIQHSTVSSQLARHRHVDVCCIRQAGSLGGVCEWGMARAVCVLAKQQAGQHIPIHRAQGAKGRVTNDSVGAQGVLVLGCTWGGHTRQ